MATCANHEGVGHHQVEMVRRLETSRARLDRILDPLARVMLWRAAPSPVGAYTFAHATCYGAVMQALAVHRLAHEEQGGLRCAL